MKKLITSLANTILSMFNFFETWTKRREAKAIEKKKEQTIERVNEVRKDVIEGNEQDLNRIIEDKRIRDAVKNSGSASIAGLFSTTLACAILCSFFLATGCITRTKTIVVPADRYVSRIEHNGITGWFVPDATMADLMENYVKIQKLDEGQEE